MPTKDLNKKVVMHDGDKNENFSERVERAVRVATIDDVNLMLHGILLLGDPEGLRIYTTEIKHAEKIAFLSPDAYVEIRICGDIAARETTCIEFHSLS
ncbi:hypothetical protein [Pantoea sp. OXWO6B1]|uniref:hypothetical protein n=1 Tax=Pantoea sp. OXWO6B1 TaxID=1835724 RepID=UPI0007C8396A|nr:hypothetical protein [Pantoea sp. OXWO6B1]OAD97846.1 hypothetical protein A6A26_21905 [Pantoea sp. OXWO6B1]